MKPYGLRTVYTYPVADSGLADAPGEKVGAKNYPKMPVSRHTKVHLCCITKKKPNIIFNGSICFMVG